MNRRSFPGRTPRACATGSILVSVLLELTVTKLSLCRLPHTGSDKRQKNTQENVAVRCYFLETDDHLSGRGEGGEEKGEVGRGKLFRKKALIKRNSC